MPLRTCTRPCLLITFNVLISSGDVQINLGPRQMSVFPCGYCQLNVGWETSGINCNNCDIWFHKLCAELSVGEYNRLSEISLGGNAIDVPWSTNQALAIIHMS